jgi:hypothetical protein
MKTELPEDLLSFLGTRRTLDFDTERSEVGPVKLVRKEDLKESTITTHPGCQSIIEDPYDLIDGLYQIEVYDLIAGSDRFGTEGLLCWIVALKCYASVDGEHGDILTFPEVTWTEIVKDPQMYLDAQWDTDGVGTRALPWLHFPLKVKNSDIVLAPYGTHCPVHAERVTVKRLRRPALSILQWILTRREWLPNYLARFPCSGLPISKDELLCCSACYEAEKQWMANLEARGFRDQP